MSQQELLKRVVEALEAGGVPYMLTGSYVSSFYGEPRTSHDVDFVVEMTDRDVDPLLRHFESPGFLLQRSSMLDAVRNRAMFNLLELQTGDKVDFWLTTDDAFDESRMNRRLRKKFAGCTAYLPTAEDVILAKLKWTKKFGGSEKQFTDALRVYEVQGAILDVDYIDKWAIELKVQELWQRVKSEATDIEHPPK